MTPLGNQNVGSIYTHRSRNCAILRYFSFERCFTWCIPKGLETNSIGTETQLKWRKWMTQLTWCLGYFRVGSAILPRTPRAGCSSKRLHSNRLAALPRRVPRHFVFILFTFSFWFLCTINYNPLVLFFGWGQIQFQWKFDGNHRFEFLKSFWYYHCWKNFNFAQCRLISFFYLRRTILSCFGPGCFFNFQWIPVLPVLCTLLLVSPLLYYFYFSSSNSCSCIIRNGYLEFGHLHRWICCIF